MASTNKRAFQGSRISNQGAQAQRKPITNLNMYILTAVKTWLRLRFYRLDRFPRWGVIEPINPACDRLRCLKFLMEPRNLGILIHSRLL